MKMRLSISAVIAAFGLVLAIGFGAVVLTSAYALRELKVGGPLYDKIKLGNDLVADILPPPEYVLEAYLEATLALRNSKNVEAHAKRLAQLKKDYEDRKTFWTGSALEPELKS
ncbi:MAG: methyl-accepting chemotaxis protein, partial [Bradyrhizobium sp.]|nr:methyl-accepting chemotaxis protein [Bradyrhizobium sp.]